VNTTRWSSPESGAGAMCCAATCRCCCVNTAKRRKREKTGRVTRAARGKDKAPPLALDEAGHCAVRSTQGLARRKSHENTTCRPTSSSTMRRWLKMAKAMPDSLDALAQISGVGAKKSSKPTAEKSCACSWSIDRKAAQRAAAKLSHAHLNEAAPGTPRFDRAFTPFACSRAVNRIRRVRSIRRAPDSGRLQLSASNTNTTHR